LRKLVNEQFPSAQLFDRFAEMDVELMIVNRVFFDPKTILAVVPDKYINRNSSMKTPSVSMFID